MTRDPFEPGHLRDHGRITHNTSNRKYTCDLCKQDFLGGINATTCPACKQTETYRDRQRQYHRDYHRTHARRP